MRPVRPRAGGRLLPFCLVLCLGACGSRPPAPAAAGAPVDPPRAAPSATAPDRPDGAAAFEHQQRERAEIAQRQGRLADAALAWEVLTVLRPQRSEYRERLAAARAAATTARDDRVDKGAAAYKRGDLDGAAQHYLAALALDPTHDASAEALRSIERERQRRHGGRLARDPWQRRGNGEADPRVQPNAPRQPAAARPVSAKNSDKVAARPATAASAAR
jgi:tetratricopeptide (TPR) repeat protein